MTMTSSPSLPASRSGAWLLVPQSTAMGKVASQQRRRSCPVDVVVTEDCDAFSALDRVRKSRRSGAHIGKHLRVRHQRAYGGVKEGGNVVRLHIAPGKNARHQIGHTMALRDCKRTC